MSTDTTAKYDSLRMVEHAQTDDHLIQLWLHGKSENTKEAYVRDINQFRGFADNDLSSVKLQDLQSWYDSLQERGMADATIARKMASVKSLYTFGQKIGYFTFNVGAAIRSPKVADDLVERILDRDDVLRVLNAADTQRNEVLIRLFYATGGRVSELKSLHWRSVIARRTNQGAEAGQIMLKGKGNKNRNILLSSASWRALSALRDSEQSDGFGDSEDPVFRSRKGGMLSRQQLWKIVKDAARRAGLPKAVSPHWLRHAHASHALDEGAPVHLVKETLGHKSLATTSRYTHAKPDDSSSNYLDV